MEDRAPTPKPAHNKAKVILLVLGIIVFLGIIGSANSSNKSSETVTGPAAVSSSTSDIAVAPTPSVPVATVPKLSLSNATFKETGYGYYGVDGEATNNDTIEHSASLKATFYDAAGKILGTASGAINDVAPGETKTYSLSGKDAVTGYATMKVQVDTLL